MITEMAVTLRWWVTRARELEHERNELRQLVKALYAQLEKMQCLCDITPCKCGHDDLLDWCEEMMLNE